MNITLPISQNNMHGIFSYVFLFMLEYYVMCHDTLISASKEINTESGNLNSLRNLPVELMRADYKTWNQHFTIGLIRHNS